MIIDAVIRIRFKTAKENGRLSDVAGQFYACPLLAGGAGFDCRIFLGGQRMELGKSYEVPVKFLSRDDALAQLKVGQEISLWEGKIVADGSVLWLGEHQSQATP